MTFVFLRPVFLALGLFAAVADAQRPFTLPGEVRFDSTAQADQAFAAAPGLQARVDLVRPLAAAYLRAHAYEKLKAALAGAAVPEDAAWQRTFLLAVLQFTLGDTDETVSLLKQLPEPALRDPAVLRFRIAHPGLFGDNPLQATPGIGAGPPVELARNYLDTMEPDQAMAVIAAHPDDFLDDLAGWRRLTGQLADQNLAPRLVPLLAARAEERPDDWEMSLTLAEFQLVAGDTRAATAGFQRIYDWPTDPGTPAPTPAERVSALEGVTLWNIRRPSGPGPLERVKTLANARDLALIVLAGLADERREGPAFIGQLEERHRHSRIEWITALMLIDSPGLVLRELHSALAEGPPPGLAAVAVPWLRGHHPDKRGADYSEQDRRKLAAAYASLPATPGAPTPAPDPSTASDLSLPRYTRATGIFQGEDPKAKEDFITELARSYPSEWEERFLLRFFLDPNLVKSGGDPFVRAAAVLLAKAVVSADDRIAALALERPLPWRPPTIRPFPGRRPGPPDTWNGRPTEPPQPVNEQVAAAFLAYSAPYFSPRPGSLESFPSGAMHEPTPDPLRPALLPALERLATDASSPLRDAARAARAYVMHGIPGQEDRALDLLRQIVKESPSDAARFWLTAFLAQKQQYAEAGAVFETVPSVPGNLAAFLQGGRAVLQRAAGGEPPFANGDPAAAGSLSGTPGPSRTRVSDTAGLLRELDRITYDKQRQPAAEQPGLEQRAVAIANKLSALRPANVAFPKRLDVLKVLAQFGGLDEEIGRIEATAREFPDSADAQLALGDAWSLSPHPPAPAASVAAYREAFRLAPGRTDIAQKLLDPRFTAPERTEAFLTLLRDDSTRTWSTDVGQSTLFQDRDAMARYAKAYGEGFLRWGRSQISGNFGFQEKVKWLRKAGLDDEVIDMLKAMIRSSPLESSYYMEPEKILIGLLDEKGRASEITPVVDRVLFPSEYLYGLDLASGPTMPLLDPTGVPDFLRKADAPGQRAALKEHARQIMTVHPGGSRAPLALLMLLIMDNDPALAAELPRCLAALRENQEERLDESLMTLARMAANSAAAKPATFELLAEARRRGTGKRWESGTLELLATLALDLGDRPRAEQALGEMLQTIRAQKKPFQPGQWASTLGLLVRAGMLPEAEELAGLTFGPAAVINPGPERGIACLSALAYIETCLADGQPDLGRKEAADFQRLLAADLAGPGEPGRLQYDLNQKFLAQIVEAFVSLDLADEAAKALHTLEESHPAAELPALRQAIEAAQGLLAQATGGPGALPVAFVEGGQGLEMSVWWDVAAMGTESESRQPPRVSVFGADLKSLAGRYSVEILAGDTPNHLYRLVTIPRAPGRGEWHGTPDARPGAIHFTRVILTDADRATVIGPARPVVAGEERLADPDLRGAVAAGGSTPQWTLPEGVLSTVPGPVPGRSGVAFVYEGPQGDCEIRGARVPVQPGESFVQSGWLRSGQGCRWGRRYFDAQGKELGEREAWGLDASYDTPGWNYVEQRLDPAPASPETGRTRPGETMPAGTAFIEPYLKFGYGLIGWEPKAPVRWAGLSLRSISPGANESGTPERGAAVPYRLDPEATGKTDAHRTETLFAGFPEHACKIAASPESDLVVVGCTDGTLHFLAYPSGKELAAVHAHDDPIRDLAVLPAHAGVYSVDTRGDTHLVSLQPAKDELVAWTAHEPGAAVIVPAQKWVIFAHSETQDEPAQDKIRIEAVDLLTGKPVNVREEAGSFNSMALSPDGKHLEIRQPQRMHDYLVNSWELPSFDQLPNRTDHMGRSSASGTSMNALFAADPARSRYVMVDDSGEFMVRTMDNQTLWTFDPVPGAASLLVMPKDGVILLCKADGKVWRYVSPK